MRYVPRATREMVMASAVRERISLLIDQSDVQNDNGRKNIETKVKSLTFSPSRVEARLSITALALKSWYCQHESLDLDPKIFTYSIP